MNSCRFDLPDWVQQNELSTSAAAQAATLEEPNELQLAGYLGKTLLDRNNDLEAKLKRLEEFTEETLHTNKALSREVKGYHESLKFANKSCEHLEQKLEESESELKEAKLTMVKQEATIQVKMKIIEDLQLSMEALESENQQLEENLKLTAQKDGNSSSNNNSDGLSKLERSHSYAEGGSGKTKEMQDLVDDLTQALNDTKYQKNKMKQSVDIVASENKMLKELLMKAEAEVIELEAQVRVLEDQSQPATPIPTPLSPGRRAVLHSSMSNPGTSCPHCNGSLYETIFEVSPSSEADNTDSSPSTNDTLFTELQNESNTLQLKFDKLVQDCTCSASIPYKEVTLDTPPPFVENSSTSDSTVTKESDKETTSLKDLFEEVYMSLKKTSVVADQLLSTRKNGITP